MPILRDIPTHLIPVGIQQEYIAFSVELSQRLEREKEGKESEISPVLWLCWREGIRQNCETCALVKKRRV
jgi:hypothetical protein